MEKYKVYVTDTFRKLYLALDGSEQQWIQNIKSKLEENPTGKILLFKWFREKKYLNKRLYFLINEETKKILFIAFASKKDQQKIIDFVKENMEELLNHLKSL